MVVGASSSGCRAFVLVRGDLRSTARIAAARFAPADRFLRHADWLEETCPWRRQPTPARVCE
eukprot:scaffold5535_cov180-Amphora_coffeaeformis.AAC.4